MRHAAELGREVGHLVAALSAAIEQVHFQLGRGDMSATELDGLGVVAERVEQHRRAVLDLARPRRARTETVDVGPQVAAAIFLLRETGMLDGIELCLDLPLQPLLVRIDRALLGSMVVNLVTNAVEALRERRTPQPYEGPLVMVSVVSNDAETVTIVVEDRGPGIPTDRLEQLFHTFATTKDGRGGAGLGLAIVREAVEKYAGDVDVRSHIGEGARFTVVLPLA